MALRRLWAVRRRPVCWILGHQHERLNRAGTARIFTSFCQRCYRTPPRPKQRVWWSA